MSRVEVRVPAQGDGVDTCLLVEWLAHQGDQVAAGHPLFVVETGKADFTVDAPVGGRLVEVLAAEGDEVAVHAVVALLETDEAPG